MYRNKMYKQLKNNNIQIVKVISLKNFGFEVGFCSTTMVLFLNPFHVDHTLREKRNTDKNFRIGRESVNSPQIGTK